ncbi:hypothetical protein R1flu_000082 [Riccia fluitans]|uniref:RING-type E3 ubiquitin transferase n=1 Tax=Riccia fluitans TaxID=41844 RepID=A0ABD1Y2K3_9MARC
MCGSRIKFSASVKKLKVLFSYKHANDSTRPFKQGSFFPGAFRFGICYFLGHLAMADLESETPQIEGGTPALPTDGSSSDTSGGQTGHQQAQSAVPGHWCYQCSKEVIAEPQTEGVPDSMVCSECRSGFIEALTTAQTVPDVRRAQRRRRRRATADILAGASPGATPRHMVPLSEALEHLYPQQLMQVMHLLGQAARRSNNGQATSQGDENQTSLQNGEADDPSPATAEAGEAATLRSFLSSFNTSREESSGGQEGRSDTFPDVDDLGNIPPLAAADVAQDRISQDGHLVFIRGASPGPDDADAEEELGLSDAETEEGLQLEYDAWDSADEDDDEEWEEVDEDEETAETGVDDDGGEENDAELQEGEQQHEQNGEEERQIGTREFRLRTRNTEHNVHRYLQELLQNLVGQNIEVRVELPDGPTYVGNPGDYVDARGFEMILQQMAENDNSRRGAPPASKAAVECLPSISIEQSHVNDGSAVCAICKDVVAVGEPAKQLPCFHLYHEECILPWLNSRNSCPVCRYELPTDDPDYEEQKRSMNGTARSNNTSQSSSSLARGAEDGLQGNISAGGELVSDASSHQSSVRDTSVNVVEPTGTSTSESQGEQVPSAGDEGHPNSATDLSLSQGSDSVSTHNPNIREQRGERLSGETESEFDRGETLRGTGRGWFLLAAGPVLSVMGFVLVLCLGNHFIGGRMQHFGRPLERQQHQFFREPQIEQIGGASEVQGRRRWWMPFQR